MCGIAGIISKNLSLTTQQRIQQSTATLTHRGPEDEGYWQNNAGTVTFGHKRLCIIDVHQRSKQPMQYLDRYTIVYNGELYNYPEVKKTLEQKEYTFRTNSDTEVVVAAYAAYKESCLNYFDGMFAFAIWDEQEQRLFAARDRFGEKPFFFFYNEEQLQFASEMKGLWAAGIPKEVNHAMLYNYLTIGYTSNPYDPQETFYANIYKLPASSFLLYSLSDHQLSIEKYWQVDTEVTTSIKDNEVIERFKELLNESVRRRLRSDVAIGTSLSGGLDSSSIVALCSTQVADQYSHKCFTAIFPGFEKSEENQAAMVAKKFGLDHHLVEVDDNDLVQQIDKLMHFQEEPIGSASVWAQYKTYEAAKQNGVTVLLDGQGADEILAGYHKYYKWYWQELYARKWLHKSGELQAAKALGVKEDFSLKNKAAALFPHFALAMLQSSKAKQAFKRNDLNRSFAFNYKQSFYYSLPAVPGLNGALYFNSFVYGLEELLRYADRNSMAHSVEVRLPYLSHHLVEFLFTLPAHVKIRNSWTKWLLRQSIKHILPEEITWRKDKVGFEPPQKQWMKNKQIQEAVQESKKLLLAKDILSKAALEKKIITADAYAADNYDWRYWSASYLFK